MFSESFYYIIYADKEKSRRVEKKYYLFRGNFKSHSKKTHGLRKPCVAGLGLGLDQGRS